MLTGLFINSDNTAINFAEKEILGAEYIQPIPNLMAHLAQHRGLTNVLKNGTDVADQIQGVRTKIASNISAIDAVNAAHGEILKVNIHWAFCVQPAQLVEFEFENNIYFLRKHQKHFQNSELSKP